MLLSNALKTQKRYFSYIAVHFFDKKLAESKKSSTFALAIRGVAQSG